MNGDHAGIILYMWDMYDNYRAFCVKKLKNQLLKYS